MGRFLQSEVVDDTTPKRGTLPKTNIVPENQWLEDDSFPFGIRIAAYFQGQTVHFREGKLKKSL